MTVNVTHLRTSVNADGPDPSQLQPSDWLDDHVVTGVTDELVKTSSGDTTAGYLASKLVAGTNVTLTETSSGSRTITVAATGGSSLSVTDGSTTVNPASSLSFTSGATVTNGGSGVAQVAVTGGGGGGGDFTSAMSRFEDDCWFASTSDRHAGNTTQSVLGTGAVTSSGGGTALGNHPGIIQLSAGTTTTGRCCLFGGEYYVGGGTITFETVLAVWSLSTGTDTFIVRAGLADIQSAEPNDGIYVRYTDSVNSGKWQGVTRNGGSETAHDLGVTATSIVGVGQSAAFIRLGWVLNAAATSVQFYINGSAAGTAITTNIPSSSTFLELMPANIKCSAGTSFLRVLLLDYYSLQFDFTTPR